jgi:hypothetical protein
MGAVLAVAIIGLSTAVAIGWLSSTGDSLIYAALPATALFGLYFAAHPVWLLWSSLIGGLVVSGLVRLYVPQLQLLRWALAPIAILLLLQAVAASLRPQTAYGQSPLPAAIPWAFGFIAICILGSLLGDFHSERFIIGLKGYLQVWGLLFAMAFYPWPARVIDRIPKFLFWIAMLQLPFVLHQLVFLVPRRIGMGDGIVPIDVVAGTFGANLEGGGANAILNAFLMVVLAGVLAARQLHLISTRMTVLLAVPLLFPVLVNEAKVSVLYWGAVFLVLYGKDMLARPLRFFAAAVSGLVVLALMLTAYTLNAPSSARVESWTDLVRFTYEYNVANDEISGQFSRVGAVKFWWEQHGFDNLEEAVLGHGVGYTRVADTDADFRKTVRAIVGGIPLDIDLNKNIGYSAVAALLWETGLLGLLCIFALLAATFRAAGRLVTIYADVPQRVATLRAIRAGCAIIFITLWHKNVFVFDVAYQTFVMLLIGIVAYWERQARVLVRDPLMSETS